MIDGKARQDKTRQEEKRGEERRGEERRGEERRGLPAELIVASVFRECCSDREGLRLVH
jgi:hypothetical protein